VRPYISICNRRPFRNREPHHESERGKEVSSVSGGRRTPAARGFLRAIFFSFCKRLSSAWYSGALGRVEVFTVAVDADTIE